MSGALGPGRSLSSQLTSPTHPPISVSLCISCSLTQLTPIVFFPSPQSAISATGGATSFCLLSGGSWWQRGACAANAACVAYGSPFPLPPPALPLPLTFLALRSGRKRVSVCSDFRVCSWPSGVCAAICLYVSSFAVLVSA
jgi:hypothetical protein